MPQRTTVGQLAQTYQQQPVLRALVNLLPGGGSLGELLIARADEIVRERLRVFFDELASGRMELTEELVQGEDSLHACLATVRAASHTRPRDKIRLLARLLLGSVRGIDLSSIDEYEELLASLDLASARELALLALLDTYNAGLPQNPGLDAQNAARAAFYSECRERLGIERADVPSALARIERTGFFKTEQVAGGEDGYTTMRYSDSLGFGELSPAYHRLKGIVGDLDRILDPARGAGDER